MIIRREIISGLFLVIFVPVFCLAAVGPAFASDTATNTINTNQVVVAGTNAPATNAPSLFLDPLDHWFDASGFLDTRYGFLPMALPITEPAVGYGGAGGLMFVDRNPRRPDGKPVPPTLTGVAGAGTENGTWGIFALNSAWWRDGTIQTRVAGGYAKVNLKYYGLGNSPFNNNPLKYTLEPLGGLAEARFRLGQSDWMAGGGYVYAATEVSFDGNVVPPGINLPSSSSHMGGLKPVILYDSRDNIFTPTKGVYAQLYAGFYAPAIASDTSFQTIEPLYIFYLPLSPKWTFGLNTGGGFSFGEAPFYARPYVELRGVPVVNTRRTTSSRLKRNCAGNFGNDTVSLVLLVVEPFGMIPGETPNVPWSAAALDCAMNWRGRMACIWAPT